MRIRSLMALCLLCICSINSHADNARKEVDDLWKRYVVAMKKDLPQTCMELLFEIKDKSAANRFDMDYFESSRLFVQEGVVKNWKLRDSLNTAWAEEIRIYDEPLLTCLWMGQNRKSREERLKFIKQNESALRASAHKDFWKRYGTLGPLYRDDYGFALWDLYLDFRTFKECSEELASYEKGHYPSGAYYEFLQCTPESYGEFLKKYEGRGVSLFAKRALLDKEFDELRDKNANGSEYKALYEKCKIYKKEYSHFYRKEKALCSMVNGINDLTDMLTGHSINLEVKDGIVKVIVSNVPSVSFSLYGNNGCVFKKRLVNQKRSFFAPDTLTVSLSDHDDGEYIANAKYRRTIISRHYTSRHISVALREISSVPYVYLADYKSGEPIDKADVIIENSKGVLAEIKDVAFDGFTPIPDEIVSLMRSIGNYTLIFNSLDNNGRHISGSISNYSRAVSLDVPQEDGLNLNALILTDRGAYSPKDTVYFKSIVYKTEDGVCLGTIEQGTECVVSLIDIDGTEVSSKSFFTNDFGSIAGQFAIPSDRKSGSYSIRLNCRDKSFSKWITVDEFTLPSYDLQFDEIDKLFFPGDEVELRGRIVSYSGHSVHPSKSVYQVVAYNGYETNPEYQDFIVSDDGSFTITFPSDKDKNYQYYLVNIRISDLTGETYEFSKSVTVSRNVLFYADLINSSEGTFYSQAYGYEDKVLLSDKAELCFKVKSCDGIDVNVPIDYSIADKKDTICIRGKANSSSIFVVDMSDLPSGIYKVNAWAYNDTTSFNILKIRPSDESFTSSAVWAVAKVDNEHGAPEILIGCGDDSPLYANVQVIGADVLLDSHRIIRHGGSLMPVLLEYKDTYPDEIKVNVFAFKDGKKLDYTIGFSKPLPTKSFPLGFASFEDRTLPETKYTFSINASPETECAVSIFDKSSESIAPNIWHSIRPDTGYSFRTSCFLGKMGLEEYMLLKSRMVDYEMEAIPNDEFQIGKSVDAKEVLVRDEFSTTLAFLPFLRSDKDGKITFSFSTSGKLSTYYVAVFAHDKQMNNNTIRREMTVTIPVKVSLFEPKYLYIGDSCYLNASVSSISTKDISGKIYFYLDGKVVASEDLMVPAGGSVSSCFELKAGVEGLMDVKAVFVSSENYSDGVRVKIPVLPQSQSLTESHSMVLSNQMSRDDAFSELQRRFVNTSSEDIVFSESCLFDRILEMFPSKAEPKGKDIISLCDALYVRALSNKLNDSRFDTDSLYREILGYQNPDGGFSWYEGMNSSISITSVILEHFAKLSKQGIVLVTGEAVESAVRYLDKCQFGFDPTGWAHTLAFERYMYVRSMYPHVPFEIDNSTELKEYRKWAREYLSMKNDYSHGDLLSKVRRINIIRNLTAGSDAKGLADKWGVSSLRMDAAMRSTLEADINSLSEYAVSDGRGGVYFPNAVMPLRGEIESEAYAHSLIADVLDEYAPNIADGVRVWLLVQKDTQKWDSTPAFIDVVSTLMDASPYVKDISILSASRVHVTSFSQIKSTSNGFKIEVTYFKEAKSGKRVPLKRGDMLQVGDKITVEYRIWSEDNRSFVHLSVPRPSTFRLVNQLSGPFRRGQAYRDVKTTSSEFYFETFPEEYTIISEEYFVTHSGTFSTPAPYVECIYAPHYRANSVSRMVRVK